MSTSRARNDARGDRCRQSTAATPPAVNSTIGHSGVTIVDSTDRYPNAAANSR